VGDERAETYLRLRAEGELRRAGDQLRGLDAAAGTDVWSDPGMSPFATAEGAHWKVIRAGRILVAAGALDRECLDRVAGELYAAIKVRSRLLLNWDRRRRMLHRTIFTLPGPQPPSGPAGRAPRVTPISRAFEVASDRAPSALHLMSLVRTGTEALITVVMRMRWPPDGSSLELEVTGAGPHHLPYGQLWAVDDQGTRYTVRFEGGQGGAVTWRGLARLSPVPPRTARRLDLVGDGTLLIELPLRPPPARGRRPSPLPEPVAISPAERLLMLEAERILATGDARGPVQGPDPGEIITVLLQTGTIAADSPLPGQLAALCQRLGAAGHGITVPPAGQIPAHWASIIAHRDAPVPAEGPELFAPFAATLPEVDGARFALAGLSTAAGESHLHVVSRGMPRLADRFAYNWTPGFSWWLTDGTGNWHVALPGEPWTFPDGTQAFRLRLTPPLAAVPDTAEVVITGPATRVRVAIPVRSAPPAGGRAAGAPGGGVPALPEGEGVAGAYRPGSDRPLADAERLQARGRAPVRHRQRSDPAVRLGRHRVLRGARLRRGEDVADRLDGGS